MQKWSDFLVQRRLSDTLLEEIAAETPDLPGEAMQVLGRTVSTQKELTELRKQIKALNLPTKQPWSDELKHELSDIAEDLRWAKTDTGKTRLIVNDWHQSFHAEFRAHPEFGDVYIGTLADEPWRIAVDGEVAGQKELEALKTYVQSKAPPFAVEYRAKVSSA